MADIDDDLHAHIDTDRWRIEDDTAANWALRKLAAYETEQDRINTQAFAEIARINEWRAARLAALTSHTDFFQARLAEYLRNIRRANPDTKTYHLPAGTIASRTTAGAIRILDEPALIEWAETNEPDLVTVKKTVSKTAIKKLAIGKDGVSLIAATGERIPHVEHVPGDERITANPATGGAA